MQDIAVGRREQDEAEWERVAWQTAYLLQPHVEKGKRKITPRQLLGRGFYRDRDEQKREEAMEEYRKSLADKAEE